MIGSRVAPTAILVAYGILIALVFGVPTGDHGGASARADGRQRDPADLDLQLRDATVLVGLMLALLSGLELKLFPVSGYKSGIGGILETMTLPAVTLGLRPAGDHRPQPARRAWSR